jgi:predicted RNA binding protein YcfA (HicA-like mRNA interferase family)
MKVPRDLSGEAFAQCLCKSWGYRRVHQSGSHIILDTEEPSHQRISVPNHNALRVGTLNGLLRAVADHKQAGRESILKSL